MKLFAKLFRKKHSQNPFPKEPIAEPYLSSWHTAGMHMYRSKDEDSSVYYIDETRGIRRLVVDKYGNIQNFPGIIKEDFWTCEVAHRFMKPQIRFSTYFERRDGKIIMLWEIQPDGRYWGDDDGFGMEHDVEVILYAFLNNDGFFEGPFRIYKLDTKRFL